MISIVRKEACSGSIHVRAHISTLNCSADCLATASAKADNLIPAVKTGKLFEVYIHPNFRTLMEHKAFLSTWCRTFMHTREKNVLFLNALKVSLVSTPQEGPFHVMCVRKEHTQVPKEPKDYDWNQKRKRLKKKSECYENNVSSRRHKHSVLQTSNITFCGDPVCVLVSCDHFSHSVLLSFLSQRCNYVVIHLG